MLKILPLLCGAPLLFCAFGILGGDVCQFCDGPLVGGI